MKRKLRGRNAVEVFASTDGSVCIRETCPLYGERVIALRPDQVPAVVKWLRECFTEVAGPGSLPVVAAELAVVRHEVGILADAVFQLQQEAEAQRK